MPTEIINFRNVRLGFNDGKLIQYIESFRDFDYCVDYYKSLASLEERWICGTIRHLTDKDENPKDYR